MENMLKGLATAIIDDGVVDNEEIKLLHRWLISIDIPTAGPTQELRSMIDRVCADGKVTSAERRELLAFLKMIARHIPSSEKGYEFEKYVLSQFNKDQYRLHEWRGDKYLRGWGGPPSNSSPDLELEDKKSGERFAIECKYRTHLSDKKFMWTTPIKHRKYIAYQQKTHIPVYVAFGLSGEPMAPAFFAVMPLVAIQYPGLYIDVMAPYRRDGEGLTLDEIKHPTMRCRVPQVTRLQTPDVNYLAP